MKTLMKYILFVFVKTSRKEGTENFLFFIFEII